MSKNSSANFYQKNKEKVRKKSSGKVSRSFWKREKRKATIMLRMIRKASRWWEANASWA